MLGILDAMRSRSGVLSVVLIVLAALLCGCSVAGDMALGTVADSGPPRLGAGDKIRLTVFGEDKLSGDYEIDPGGFVSLPLAGTVKAAGLTKPEFEKLLTENYRSKYLRNPKVTVDIASYHPFYVLGEVQKPGEYPFRSGLNVMSAIAIAGGQTYRASTSTVKIQRAGTTSFADFPMAPSVPVYSGDVIRVPERYF